MNSLEDLRIEKAISKLGKAIESDLAFLNRTILADVNKSVANGDTNLKPVDEALLAMHMIETGVSPMWVLSEKAQRYFDAAYPIYQTWQNIRNLDNKYGFEEIETIADKVIAAFKEAIKNEPNNQNDNQDGDTDNQEDNEQNNQQNKGNNKNNAENENNGGSGASSDPEDEGKEGDDNQDGDNGEGEGESEDEEGKDEGNEAAADNKDNGENADDNGKSKEGKEAENNQRGNDNQRGENNGKGENDTDSGDAADSNQQGSDDCHGDSKPTHEVGDANDDVKGKETSGKNDAAKNANKKAEKREKSDKEIESELNDDFANANAEEKALSKKLEKIFEKSKEISNGYTSYTGEDRIIPASESKDGYEQARKDISTQIAQLSNYTEDALKAMSRVAYQRNLERGKIDSRKLVGLSKSLTQKVFYKTTDGIDLDVAVTVMIDESGSIGMMCYQLRSLAIAFSEVFTKLNIKFEVLGFTTDYNGRSNNTLRNVVRTEPMRIYEHKTFAEPYQVAKYKLGSISAYNCNIDGEALLLAFKRIKQQHTHRHIIFVLSDGMPNQGYNSAALYRHLSDSVKFVRNNGVEVYGFGIGTDEPEKFYGKDNFVYLEDIKKLGPQFFRRFREIVTKR